MFTVIPAFETKEGEATKGFQAGVIEAGLKELFPPECFKKGLSPDDVLKLLGKKLPIIRWNKVEKTPGNLRVQLLCRSRLGVSKFFFDMTRFWIVPGKQLEPYLLSSLDFQLPELTDDFFVLAEIVLKIDSDIDAQLVKRNMPIIASELRLGVESPYHAGRILEIKGLSADEKAALIQQNIAFLIRRRPNEFGPELLTEMQHFLVMCGPYFKEVHEYRQMSRIICVHYYFRRLLRRMVETAPGRRHMKVKLLKVRLHSAQGRKKVLGVFVGLNLLSKNEVFEERHLMRAIRDHLPEVTMVENSFFASEARGDGIRTLYLELVKPHAEEFTSEEIRHLRERLPLELQGAVERQMHSVFAPRNEEETMRHILTLSQQLKYLSDLPQVIINFHEQTDHDLVFTAVVLRVMRRDTEPFEKLVHAGTNTLRVAIESCRTVGFLRKKYEKEACVLRLFLPKGDFLRGDHAIDLYRARQAVVEELERIIGDFRDYYGGMIAKQHELYDELRELVKPTSKRHELTLENFFHSLTPGVMRTVLEAKALAKLYSMLKGGVDRRSGAEHRLSIREEENYVFVMSVGIDGEYREAVLRGMEALKVPSIELGSVEVKFADANCLGFVYRGDDLLMRRRLVGMVENILGASTEDE